MDVAARTFDTTEAFYADDERRRRSPEADYGVWWRARGVVYRLTYVDATGEVIAVQLTPARSEAFVVADVPGAPELFGLGFRVTGGAPESVTVIGRVATRDELERILDGWGDVLADSLVDGDSLVWVLEQLAAAGAGLEASS